MFFYKFVLRKKITGETIKNILKDFLIDLFPNINYRYQFSVFSKKLEEKFSKLIESNDVNIDIESNDKESTFEPNQTASPLHTPQKKSNNGPNHSVFQRKR